MSASDETVIVANDGSNISKTLEFQKNGFKLELAEKLIEVDRRYKQGVSEYKENIQTYNIEIEKLKNKIILENEYCDKEEKKLLMIEHELVFENKVYDKLQTKFSQLFNSIEELKNEYKDLLDEVHYEVALKRKEKDLFECLDDIELSELALLNKELERLNILESFKPKQMEVKRIQLSLKELEMEKSYFESIGLHKVSTSRLENKAFWEEESFVVVDTIEIENDKA